MQQREQPTSVVRMLMRHQYGFQGLKWKVIIGEIPECAVASINQNTWIFMRKQNLRAYGGLWKKNICFNQGRSNLQVFLLRARLIILDVDSQVW